MNVNFRFIRELVKNYNLWGKTESAANCGSLLKVNVFFFALEFYISTTLLNPTIQSRNELNYAQLGCRE